MSDVGCGMFDVGCLILGFGPPAGLWILGLGIWDLGFLILVRQLADGSWALGCQIEKC